MAVATAATQGPAHRRACAAYPSGTCGSQSDGCGGLTPNCGTCTSPAYCRGSPQASVAGNDGRLPRWRGSPPRASPRRAPHSDTTADPGGGRLRRPIRSCGPACIAPRQVCGGAGGASICGNNLRDARASVSSRSACDTKGDDDARRYGGRCNADDVPACRPDAGRPRAERARLRPERRRPAVHPEGDGDCGPAVHRLRGRTCPGKPLVLAYTKFDGTFSYGERSRRWRPSPSSSARALAAISSYPAMTNTCGTNTVNDPNMPAGILKMPNNQTVGDIPLTAISTGQVDALECVLLKMGIDATEFTTNAAATPGRVNLFMGNGSDVSGGGAPSEASLMDTGGTFNAYDQILLPCWGAPITKDGTELGNLITYADTGGHFFATHYSYTRLITRTLSFEHGAVGRRHWAVRISRAPPGTITAELVPAPTRSFSSSGSTSFRSFRTLPHSASGSPQSGPSDDRCRTARRRPGSWQLGRLDRRYGPSPHRGDPAPEMLPTTRSIPPVTPGGGSQPVRGARHLSSDFHVINATSTSGQMKNSDCATGQCNGNNCGRRGATCTCSTAQFPADANLPTYCGTTPMTAQEKDPRVRLIGTWAPVCPGRPAPLARRKHAPTTRTGTWRAAKDGCGGLPHGGLRPACPTGQVVRRRRRVSSTGAARPTPAPVPRPCTAFAGMCGQQSDGCGGLTATCTCPAGPDLRRWGQPRRVRLAARRRAPPVRWRA